MIKPEDEATFKDDPKLRYASDLVRQIRNEWGSEFTVCVAGYPQVMYLQTESKYVLRDRTYHVLGTGSNRSVPDL